jgi:glycosyltransferase involved in cell wall biosynthesis
VSGGGAATTPATGPPRRTAGSPLVSVVIPTHNRAHYITEAIDSVLAQTYPYYEIIVIDDGSTDNTREVLRGYGDRVRYFHQDGRGQAHARNRAVSEARGKYIAMLDDDDVWLPNKLELQVATLEQDDGVGFVGTDMYITDASGNIIDRWGKPPSVPETFESLFEENILGAPSVMIRKRLIEEVGGFDESLRTTDDYDLWLRLARVSRFKCLAVPTVKWRMHGSNKHKDRPQKLKDRVRILTRPDNIGHLGFVARRLRMAKLYFEYAEEFRGLGLPGLAARTYLRAVVSYPFIGRYYWTQGGTGPRGWRPCRILTPYSRAVLCSLRALPIRRGAGVLHGR